MSDLMIYKTHPSVVLPKFATDESACFDLSACFAGKYEVKGYNVQNKEIVRTINSDKIAIMPGDRLLIPTGMIFDIPTGYSIRIHARSGLSLKNGLILANCEAVIDADYTLETMVMLTNISENGQHINDGDRIAQAELVVQPKYSIVETHIRPIPRANRVGGLGSTGVTGVLTYVTEPHSVESKTPEQSVKRGRGRPRKVSLDARSA